MKLLFTKTSGEVFNALVNEVRACRACAAHLPAGPRPVLQVHPEARILNAGQAPGREVHESGVPFDDASGERLRQWLGVTRETFYDATRIAILPPWDFAFRAQGAWAICRRVVNARRSGASVC